MGRSFRKRRRDQVPGQIDDQSPEYRMPTDVPLSINKTFTQPTQQCNAYRKLRGDMRNRKAKGEKKKTEVRDILVERLSFHKRFEIAG
jgi:hypothetical protein